MLVLNLDLDVFMGQITYGSIEKYEYLPASEASPDSVDSVFKFAKQNLGLSEPAKTPARLVKHHHEALDYWKELIEGGSLKTPFDLHHVDAHGDVGFGGGEYMYICTELMHYDITERINRPKRKLTAF